MKVAVMQPYIFPYLGYFQLINAVDTFVFYDDVNFIKQGWINRNKILINGQENLFTIPIKKASSFELINQTELHPVIYKKWKNKFLKGLEQSYKKAPFFSDIFPVIENLFDKNYNTISDLSMVSIKIFANYLVLETKFEISSEKFSDTRELDRTKRLQIINKSLQASTYINAIGGRELYNKEDFKQDNIDLKFLKPELKAYKQFDNNFISGLSIIDVLMFNSKEEVRAMCDNYTLV